MKRLTVQLADQGLLKEERSLEFHLTGVILLRVSLEDGRTVKLTVQTDGEVTVSTYGNRPDLTAYVPQAYVVTNVRPEDPFVCLACGEVVFDEDSPDCPECA